MRKGRWRSLHVSNWQPSKQIGEDEDGEKLEGFVFSKLIYDYNKQIENQKLPN